MCSFLFVSLFGFAWYRQHSSHNFRTTFPDLEKLMLTWTFRSCLSDSLAFSQCASNNQALSFTCYYLGAKWNVYWLVCHCTGSDATAPEKTRLKWVWTGKEPWLSSHPLPVVLASHGWTQLADDFITCCYIWDSWPLKQVCDSSVFREVNTAKHSC